MEVINKFSFASDFAVFFQRIMMLAKELDGMREYYCALNKQIVSARAAQTAVIIANDISLGRLFDPILKMTERALRYVESGTYK